MMLVLNVRAKMTKKQSDQIKKSKERKVKEVDPNKMTSQLAIALYRAANRCKLPV